MLMRSHRVTAGTANVARMQVAQSRLRITVEDTGVGTKEEDKEKISKPFECVITMH